jgi:hypothetical protein
MAEVLVKPAFQSAIADSGDATKLGPTAWNASRVFSGGNAEDGLIRDLASATGASWAPRRRTLWWERVNLANGADTNYITSTPYALPAGLLATDGDALELEFILSLSAAASSKTYTCNVGYTSYSAAAGFTGGLPVISNSTANASTTIIARGRITRLSATTAGYYANNQWATSATSQGTLYSTGSITWANAQNIASIGRDATGNASAITLQEVRIMLVPR